MHKLIRIGVVVIVGAVLAVTTTSCARDHREGDSSLYIRIHNVSGFDFDNLWLGTGYEFRGKVTEFGPVLAGETSGYLKIRRYERDYDSLRLLIKGEHSQSDVSAATLKMMASSNTTHYTYDVNIVGDRRASVHVVSDD